MSTTRLNVPPRNRLLASLSPGEYKRLLPQLEEVTLTFAEIIYEPGETIRHVYFPNDSIVSLLYATNSHASLEVGMIGNEGMTGVSVFMGVSQSRTRALVQGAGSGLRMESAALRKESDRLGSFHRLLHRYVHSLMTQMSLSSACNRFHSLEDRLARWLLMTHDRIGSDEFRLTQEFMSNMLGVRREGVNKVAGNLQKHSLISYTRGHVTVLDRPGLEKVSCECYGIMRQESDAGLNGGKRQEATR
jgi:CRP-like cAMP-binding protein